jgi:dTDP-4-amino-4,6-dideoxygalactose transaminase
MTAGTRQSFLPFAPPLLGDEEIAEVVETLRSGWIATGPRVARFEAAFAEAVGAPAALALSSGTAGLHLALCALGAGPGDRVVTTPMTFCSGVHVIEQTGAVPLLVDVEPGTLNIDPECVAAAVERTRRVRAIEPSTSTATRARWTRCSTSRSATAWRWSRTPPTRCRPPTEAGWWARRPLRCRT